MKKLLTFVVFLCGFISISSANASALWNTADFTGTFIQADDTKLFYPNFSVPSNTTYFGARLYSNGFIEDFTRNARIKIFDASKTQLATRDYFDEGSNQFISELFGPGTAFDGTPLPTGEYTVELSFIAPSNIKSYPLSWYFAFYSELDRDKVTVGLVEPPSPSAVPIPAAAWLFCAALLGFIGLRRKQI